MKTTVNTEIGRVLRAATSGFAVGCRVAQLEHPAFGALVAAQVSPRERVYGLIYNINVDDDPLVRRLVLAEDLRPAAIEDQRNNRLLPLEMSVLTVGYARDGEVIHALPPRPPLNLDPVVLVETADQARDFTDSLSYLRLIVRQAGAVPVDQLLAGHIHRVHALRGDDDAWALRAIGEVIELLRSNYDLLIPTLEALSAALPALPIGG